MRISLQETENQLSRFGEYLLRRHLVSERHAPFYVQWVRRFLLRAPESPTESLQERVEGFLNLLRGREGIADWQIEQAEKAIRIYFHRVEGFASRGSGR